ncbi:2-hydroxyacid dehydrogenase [Lichenihabitans psoromatis]|uniref:2-hydroxyacid dehydrogenase n=1 Tax=Lichenihabitans psoromatis TaxID=2528642 RepID=UPI001FE13A4E|nr:glyoxylate/hydroxypyruvate reductase A [Lichenihabitans psoromatis]
MDQDERHIVVVAMPAGDDPGTWIEALRPRLPNFDVLSLDAATDTARVAYVVAWKHPRGALARFPNLKAVFSLGAGVDHLLSDPDLPVALPIVRVVDPDLTSRMSEWVMLHVLMHHRQQRLYEWQQFEKIWADDATQPAAKDVRVGIMGLGVMGQDSAHKLAMMGFDVAGWSRTPKTLPGIETFSGDAGLGSFLARTQILVSLLPLTSATRGILDLGLFRQLARDSHVGGPVLINAGRGGLQNEADILTALDEGLLRAATLDVFETEPLPQTSEFWHHPAVMVTPHNAAISSPQTIAAFIADQIEAAEDCEPLEHVVDRNAEY